VQLERLEGRQGRLSDALAAADRAEQLIGHGPAIDRFRGDAYAQVWRWSEAATAYGAAANAAPSDDSMWGALARACGSIGDMNGTLVAVRSGLPFQPRDESMLRSQAVVLTHEGDSSAELARTAFADHRVNDRLSELRLECGRNHAFCAIERVPTHVHQLRSAP
jgi:predicted Zn-dependent protease